MIMRAIDETKVEMAAAGDTSPLVVLMGGTTGVGKSTIATQLAAVNRDLPIRGLVLLGYPLHPPGRPEQLRDRHLLRPAVHDARCRARKELRQLGERSLGLHDGPHLHPVTEQHDRHQRRQLIPQRHPGKAEPHGDAEEERDGDRQRDERHHPRQPVLQLPPRALDEDPAAVEEDHRGEDGADPVRAGDDDRGRQEVPDGEVSKRIVVLAPVV